MTLLFIFVSFFVVILMPFYVGLMDSDDVSIGGPPFRPPFCLSAPPTIGIG